MSGPAGRVTSRDATSFSVTVSAITGNPGTFLRLETRVRGSADDWTAQVVEETAPVVGAVLTADGLDAETPLEWRIVETNGVTIYDGTHGVLALISSSIWTTLLDTVAVVLAGLGVTCNEGTALPPNPPVTGALLRTLPEMERSMATNVVEIEYPIEVELRFYATSDTGEHRTPTVASLQRSLRDAFNAKTAADFPSIPGLLETAVEIRTKDEEAQGVDPMTDEIRARLVVRFRVIEDL